MVKIFDHLFFFIFVENKDIPIWKLIRIILYCLINNFCLNAIEFSYITVNKYSLIAKGNNTIFIVCLCCVAPKGAGGQG